MPHVVRFTDLSLGHPIPPCWPPRPPETCSPNVTVNNLGVIRFGDIWVLHCCGSSCHKGNSIGKHTVTVNGRDIQVQGDPISCGDWTHMHSPNVTADGMF